MVRRLRLALALSLLALPAALPPAASASHDQVSIIQDGTHLMSDPVGTLARFRLLGAEMVRVNVFWSGIAPDWRSRARPAGFDGSDPSAYPAAAWAPYDAIVQGAARDGIAVDLTLTGGAPHWAERGGTPHPADTNYARAWWPSAAAFGAFVQAIGERYSGDYDPLSGALDPGNPADLPAVRVWGIWNEPNFGEDLAPQATHGSRTPVAPMMYRNLADRAYAALRATGHGDDTILIGELDARGLSMVGNARKPQGYPGNFAPTKPLAFVRALYCLNALYHQLRGAAARAVGCPATAAGSRSFRRRHPVLFSAGGFSDHPYPQNLPPTRDGSKDPDYATFSEIPRLERVLDRIQRIYGSQTRFPIWNTEYGYITHPPNRGRYVSPATAAYYLNWAEYLSWRAPRIRSTMQYLLYDPNPVLHTPEYGGFASGLLTYTGAQKPAYDAYRLPLYLPVSRVHGGHGLKVWGCVRPAPYAFTDSADPQTAELQFAPGRAGSFAPLASISVPSGSCYFQINLIPPGSGRLRLAYTYPWGDPLLPAGSTVYSRSVQITVS